MQLTSLRLSGFKSFSDPAELRIEPGLTGVVGPNGCGKSNIVEALRWAMGESSARGLRGGEMDDVIFNGSAGRPAFDVAEVRLGLSGPVEGLPGLQGAAEVEVARRIGRGQGSAYRLNGREARARDVQLLFADAGSGSRSPAIVGQGQVGLVVEGRPQDRRRLLEEAAGIGGLHGRRREAESRLAATGANLQRVRDLLAEQEARLGELERQDKQARRYREVAAELRSVEILFLLARHRDSAAALETARAAEDATSGLLRAAATDAARRRRAREAVAGRLPGLRETVAGQATRLAALGERRAQLAAGLERARTHRAAFERQLAELEADRAVAASAADAAAGELGRASREAEATAAELRLARPRVPTAVAVEAEGAAGLGVAEAAQRAALTEAARAGATLSAAQAALERVRGRLAAVEAALASLGPGPPTGDGEGEVLAGARISAEAAADRAEAAEAALGACEDEAALARRLAGEAGAAAVAARETLAAAGARWREAQAVARHVAERRAELERAGRRLAERERASATRLEANRAAAAGLDLPALAAASADAEHRLREADARLDAARAASAAAEARRDATARDLREGQRALDALTAELKVLESLGAEIPDGAALTWLRIPPGQALPVTAALGDDLLAGADPAAPCYWRELDASATGEEPPSALPDGAAPLLAGLAEVPPLLGRRLAQVGVAEAALAAALQPRLRPGQRLVSPEGGLWRWDGLVRAAEAEEAGAARLRHRLRLEAARAELPSVEAALAAVAEAERRDGEALAGGRAASAAAEAAWREADAAQAGARHRLAAARDRAAGLEAEAGRLAAEAADLGRERDELDRERATALAASTEAEPSAAGRSAARDSAQVAAATADRHRLEALRRAEATERALADARRAAVEGRSALEAARQTVDRRRTEAEVAARTAATVAAERRARSEALVAERGELVAAVAGLAGEQAAAAAAAAATGTGAQEAELALGRARTAREAAARDLDRARGREAALVGRLAELAAARADLDGRAAEARDRAAELATRSERVAAELAALGHGGEGDDPTAALDAEIATATSRHAAAAGTTRAAEAELAALEAAQAAAEAVAGDARERHALAQAAREHAREAVGAAATAVRERAQREPAELLAEPGVAEALATADAAGLEPRLARLRAARERIGPVNLRAGVEADELRAALGRTRAEEAELSEAVARLNQAIARLNREGRERLAQVFDRVDRHFQDLFVRLFGGGRARLSLTDADDPLACGLELEACPPGKKLTGIGLLSGGEKTLTALALVFAFFLAQPSPLCVLDEVDAPLDDANVDRFVTLMREIAAGTATRFLVVTHHPLTMARMDRLYGVTMSERGVSRLVSVDLAEAVELRATA